MIEVKIILNQDEMFPDTENILREIIHDGFKIYGCYDREKVFVKKLETINEVRKACNVDPMLSINEIMNHRPDKAGKRHCDIGSKECISSGRCTGEC